MACEDAGHEVFEAYDGPSAVPAFHRDAPHLLILDIAMPGGGGPFVLSRLRAEGSRRRCPVLVVSGSLETTPEDIRRRLDVEHVLSKPFRVVELMEWVERLLADSAGESAAVAEG